MSKLAIFRHRIDGEAEEGRKAPARHAEQERSEVLQARLAAIVESSEDAILSKSLEGVITSWNAAAEQLLGYRADEAIGEPITLIVPDEQQAEEMRILERLCRGERIEHYETFRRARDGRLVEVSLTLSPIRNKTGRIIGASTIIRDITRRRTTERALRGANERLELAQAAAQIGTFEWNQASNEITWSAPMEKLYGLPAGGFGRRWEDWRKMVNSEDWPALDATAHHAGQGPGPWKTEFRIVRPDGAVRWMAARSSLIPGERGAPSRVVGINIDITERKQAEEALRQSEAYLRHLVQERTAELRQTVAELEAFCYSLSHDMRAPLRAIQSFLQIALDSEGDQFSSSAHDFMERSIGAARRMDQLICDVLAFSRLSRGGVSLHEVDVDKLAREIIQERPELQPPQAQVWIDGALAPVRGHEALVTQCLTNLLGNAVKFVAPGVKPQVRVSSETVGDKVRLWIEDNGIGIEREAQRKMFGLFERVHRESGYDGTGVGLAIVLRAVERMGGKVGVISEPGQGSRFWVELRRAE